MSLINLNFLKENFNDEKIIFFDIGCADLYDTKDFAKILPNAEIYAFEPLKNHYDICTKRAIEYGVKFFNYALSNINGDILFYPSKKQGQLKQLQSSSIFKKTTRNIVSYGKPYLVKSVTIEAFCNDNNISPDFIHIDVEGAEYNVFMKLGEHRPKGIWVEMIGYRYYQNGRSDRSEIEDIDYELDDLLKSYGYYAAFQSNDDWLYLHKDAELKNKNYKN
jgi:FkbM family methyltransferase